MPAFNVEAFVEEAISTLHAQTHPAIELVAVNDGSTDRTGAILDRLAADWRGEGRRMIVLHQENAGAADARNAGLARAEGEFVCMLDADDRLAPAAIERLVAVLSADPDLRLAAPLWRHIDADGRPTGVVSTPSGMRHDAAGLVVSGPLHSATAVMVRAEAARQAGLLRGRTCAAASTLTGSCGRSSGTGRPRRSYPSRSPTTGDARDRSHRTGAG